MPKAIEKTTVAALQLFIIVLTPKGGVGKSLLACLLAAFLARLNRMPNFVSVDARHPSRRLIERLGIPVISADLPSGDKMSADRYAVMRAFAPVEEALAASAGRADIVLDIGSPGSRPAFEYIIRSELADRLREAGYQPVVLVPATAQFEALALAAETLKLARDCFGDAVITVAVDNYRDGRLPADDDAAMRPVLAAADVRLTMPALPPHWKNMDAANVLPAELVSMPLDDIRRLLGEDEDIARVVRGEMRVWNRRMEGAMLKVLPGLDPRAP